MATMESEYLHLKLMEIRQADLIRDAENQRVIRRTRAQRAERRHRGKQIVGLLVALKRIR